MKKIKVLLSALAMVVAMAFVSCGGAADGTSEPAASGETVAFTMTYNASAQWAAPAFTVEDDWKSLEVVFADGTDFEKIQFAVISDKVEKEESWGTSYFSLYPAATKTSTIDINNWLEVETNNESGKTLKDNGATKINKISIQNKTKDALTVKVVSAKVTKADGTVIDVKPVGDWASSVN